MSKASSSSSIELKCSLCPKNPNFSDVSHLLTHISSKSHLAHRFKLQIRSTGEANAKAQLEEFDYWYHANNLDTLLSERMAAKEKKKSGKDKDKKPRRSSGNVKKERVKKERAPAEEPTLAETPVFRAPVPRMQLWPIHTNPEGSTSLSGDWEPSAYETPTARRKIPGFARIETPPGDQLDPKLVTPWKLQPNEDDEDKKVDPKLTDSARLKGTVWPGMDLFDSATPEMKRMRNQRKDSHVLELMKTTSAGIEPAEISYHANGEFRGSRDIFGSLSPLSSPERIPSAKKRRPRKAALAEKSVNAPRIQPPRTRAPRPKKSVAAPSPIKRSPSDLEDRTAPTNNLFMKPMPNLNPLAAGGFGRRFAPSADDDDAFGLVVDDMGGKKRSFNIFQDGPEDSPARTESPLEERRFDFPAHSMPTYPNHSTISTLIQASPTPIPRPTTFRAFGKENGQPDLLTRRSHSNPANPTHMYPSQIFFDNSFNPLFNHAYASRSFPFGDPQNPYNGNGVSSGYSSNFQTGFQQAGPSARSQQSHGQASGPGSMNTSNAGNGFGM